MFDPRLGPTMNIAFPHTAEQPPHPRTFSAQDVRRMIDAGILTESENVELVEGELVVMAAKGYAHEMIKSALIVAIARTLPNDMVLGVEMSVQFTDDTILEPDLVVFRRSALIKSEENFCHVAEGEVLLAVEVAVSSLAYDRGRKAQLYSRYRVQEFWVVDANERITWIHTGPRDDGTWTSIVEHTRDATLTARAVPGFSIRLADIQD
jgi:Uma2 family endonuclease